MSFNYFKPPKIFSMSYREPTDREIEIDELNREYAGKRLLFHSTFRTNLPGIKKLGLGAAQPKNWSFSKPNVVCLALDEEEAFSYCESVDEDIVSETKYNSGIIVLGIPVEFLDRSKLCVDENNKDQRTFEYHGIIDPKHLLVITRRDYIYGRLLTLKRVPKYE